MYIPVLLLFMITAISTVANYVQFINDQQKKVIPKKYFELHIKYHHIRMRISFKKKGDK